MSAPPVYLAGDLVFRPDALALFARLKAICARHGLDGMAPFDGQEEVRGLPPGRGTIMRIVHADRDLMDRCVAGLFCVDPFRRSADMDPGTAVELGYMFARGMVLEAWTTDPRPYPDKVAAYCKAAWGHVPTLRADAGGIGSGAFEDADGMLLHSDGMVQNGMVEGFIVMSGGAVSTGADVDQAFAGAVARLAARLEGDGKFA